MIIIGEKLNGSIPSVAKAIAEKDADLIRERARLQAEAGATFLDVCVRRRMFYHGCKSGRITARKMNQYN